MTITRHEPDREPPAPVPPSRHFVVGIAASAGGITALGTLLGQVPADFPAPVLVVQHTTARPSSALARVLGRHSAAEVKHGEAQERARCGAIYVAPPGCKMTIDARGTLALHREERASLRSADLLFRSMAAGFGTLAIGVVLTGTGHDGAAGCLAIWQAGGRILIQNPVDAEYAGMPLSAIATGCAHSLLGLGQMYGALHAMVQ